MEFDRWLRCFSWISMFWVLIWPIFLVLGLCLLGKLCCFSFIKCQPTVFIALLLWSWGWRTVSFHHFFNAIRSAIHIPSSIWHLAEYYDVLDLWIWFHCKIECSSFTVNYGKKEVCFEEFKIHLCREDYSNALFKNQNQIWVVRSHKNEC